MKFFKVFFPALLLSASFALHAQDIDRIILDFSFDEEDNFHPDVNLPFSWNENTSSAFSYYSTADYDTRTVLNIAGSVNNEEINYSFINVYPLLWQSDNNTIGVDIGIIDIEKEQVGSFTDTGGAVNFFNNLDIQVIKPSFFYRFNQLTDNDNGVLYGVSFSPYSELDVSQSTSFSGAINQSGTSDGATESSISFRLELDGRHRFASGLQSYYGFQYEYLPMEYTLAVLDQNGQFTPQTFDVVEHIFKVSYKVKLDKELFSGLKPVIGISFELTDGEDSNTGDDYRYERAVVVFGIEG